MNPLPPSEDDEDAYLFVDHREEEEAIVWAVAERTGEALRPEFDDEVMYIVHAGQRHRVPLQCSPHDRYIAISSLAMLLRERFRFFVLEPSLSSDTHGLLVAPLESVAAWNGIPPHLLPLEMGYDYFHEMRVPYLGGEDSAPDFAAESRQARDCADAMGGLVAALFSGRMDEATAAKLAAVVKANPALHASAGGQSQAEMTAELLRAFEGAMAAPEVQQGRRSLDEALAALKAPGRPAPKPWWKFW